MTVYIDENNNACFCMEHREINGVAYEFLKTICYSKEIIDNKIIFSFFEYPLANLRCCLTRLLKWSKRCNDFVRLKEIWKRAFLYIENNKTKKMSRYRGDYKNHDTTLRTSQRIPKKSKVIIRWRTRSQFKSGKSIIWEFGKNQYNRYIRKNTSASDIILNLPRDKNPRYYELFFETKYYYEKAKKNIQENLNCSNIVFDDEKNKAYVGTLNKGQKQRKRGEKND